MLGSFSWLLATTLLVSGGDPEKGPKVVSERPGCNVGGKMVTTTYCVADLVVPDAQAVCDRGKVSGVSKCKNGASPTTASVKQAPKSELANATQEAVLVELIVKTVAPATWSGKGGNGTLEYFPLTMSLIVNQSADVQEQVGELLTALRRLQDLQVSVEFRMVTTSPDLLERLPAEWGHQGRDGRAAQGSENPAQWTTFLDDKQVRKLLDAFQGDRRTNVMQAPKVTMFNGHMAELNVTEQRYFLTDLKAVKEKVQLSVLPKNEAIETGFKLALRPAISADHRSVRLKVVASQTDLDAIVPLVAVTTRLTGERGEDGIRPEGSVTQYLQQPQLRTMKLDTFFQIPDGKTAVLRWSTRVVEGRYEYGPPVVSEIPYVNRLFKNVGYTRETHCVLLLVTPRIIVNEEEEVRASGGAAH